MLRRPVLAVLSWMAIFPAVGLGAEDRFFDSNGVKIHYIVEGQGEPVLLIHGFAANIQMNWAVPGVLQALARDHRVIALDVRGHGRSGKPHDPRKYGGEMVEDVVRLLDHLEIPQAHVVGYSMGAMIAHHLIATHPDRVQSATLGGAVGLRESVLLRFFDELADSLDQGRGLGPLLVALTPPGRPRPTEEQIQLASRMLLAINDPKALAAVLRSLGELALAEDQWKANRVPTLVLIGELDPLKRAADDLPRRMPRLQVRVIRGADHMTTPGHPEFLRRLQEFLARNHRRGGERPRTGTGDGRPATRKFTVAHSP